MAEIALTEKTQEEAKDERPVVLKVDHVAKMFRLPTEQATGLKMAFLNWTKGIKGYTKQHVLRDINFEVRQGDFFGIVGRNGSGKSTLLKIISQIYTPEQGSVTVKGKLVPFIELGVGFNPELTGLVPDDQIYRIYAGLREEYSIDGRRVINTQDIRLCRRTLRDAAARGRSPAKTLSMWDRVLDGETRYIKGFKTTADFLLDTSFTYELGLISRLLGEVRRQFTLEGHNAELWDETARRFEHVAPVALDLLPADSMLREFYGSRT